MQVISPWRLANSAHYTVSQLARRPFSARRPSWLSRVMGLGQEPALAGLAARTGLAASGYPFLGQQMIYPAPDYRAADTSPIDQHGPPCDLRRTDDLSITPRLAAPATGRM